VFLLSLVIPQLVAFSTQFARGFIPFTTAPGRVPYSWDMFAPPTERCILTWTPPLQIGRKTISSFNEMGPTLEWDIAYERPQDYVDAGLKFCARFGVAGNKAHMRCFHMNGTESENSFACH